MMARVNANLTRWFLELRDREEGQAAVEYGVLVALIIAVSVVLIKTLGTDIKNAFQTVVDAL
jgi:pilus assembly protein Flp/PilA